MMSANGETDHDMATDADIAVLLARAADEVEIGAAPCQAVVRGGRRRRARRWATVAAALDETHSYALRKETLCRVAPGTMSL
ncbi:hypothetical protein AB8A21_32650, partial [Streptomyces sp. BF23-18]